MEEEIKENQVSNSSIEQVPVAMPDKKSNTGLLIVISLIVILLIAVGVYVGMQLGKRQTSPSEIISESKTPTQAVATVVPGTTIIPTSDETVNWKTYSEKYVYGLGNWGYFEISYPSNWYVKDDFLTSYDLEKAGKSGFPPVSVTCSFVGKEDVRKAYRVLDEKEVRSGTLKITKFLVEQEIPVVGQVKEKNGTLVNVTNFEYYLFEAAPDRSMGLRCSNIDNPFRSTFDQILSTFKFLD